MATQMDAVSIRELTEHMRSHVRYPATKMQIVQECNRMSHVPEETRRMADKTYQDSDEVMSALGM